MLPTPHSLGSTVAFGAISTANDNGADHTTDGGATVPADYLNQLASDVQLLYAAMLAANGPIIAKVANYPIVAGDAGKRFTGAYIFSLPTALALPSNGIPFRVGFVVPNGGTISAVAVAGDFIQYGTLASNSGGNVSSSKFGTVFWLTNIGLNQWLVDSVSGSPLTITQ
jgi:hypothetical protein